MSLALADCTPRCRSTQHAEEVVSALTGGAEARLQRFLSSHCHNAAALRDSFGRTALHLAASLGQRRLLEWLLDCKGAALLAKDEESGWTALHRSAFYGHIHCLVALVKRGGSLTVQDREGLSVLDLTMKDRLPYVVFQSTGPLEVYTWGNNSNFSLGHGNQESRQHPEIIDLFARTGVYIKQVVLSKFHSVFLSQRGQVFTCGHGQGGRLGHGDQQTYLVPRLVEGLLSHQCVQVAAARDHSVVLTAEGYVYTFGLNTFHQLGLTPPPPASLLPKQVTCKSLKGKAVVGVAAGRFHTVLWTRDALYTMGLNGGQLGHLLDPNGEKCVTAPRQVSALHHKDTAIAMAAVSNGATVCVTEKGDIYLLTEYQCKKLASKQLSLRKVQVSGGSLDARAAPQLLVEGGGGKVCVLVLDQTGRVFSWRAGGSVRPCRWAFGRQVCVCDLALSQTAMLFITQEGQAFSGQWLEEYRRRECGTDGSAPAEGGCERIRLEKLPYIHRAVSITSDHKGHKYSVLQCDPRTSLLEVPSVSSSLFLQHMQQLLADAQESDSIHDITLQAGLRTFPAHKYILSQRSEFFRKLFLRLSGEEGVAEVEGAVWKGEDVVGCDLLLLEKVPAELLEQVLQFIYTDTCRMLQHGARPHVAPTDPDPDGSPDLPLKGRSARDVCRSLLDQGQPRGKSSKLGKNCKSNSTGNLAQSSPVRALQALAKTLGISSLSARLDGVRLDNGVISVVHRKMSSKPRFSRSKCSYLCDVTLRSEDGMEFRCHKCVLCARLEYFSSMLGNPWIEATSGCALGMPTTGEVLQVVLEYVYTDESPTIRDSVSVEFVCQVLVVADQLLIPRLKEICEVTITGNLTLRNAAELLEFAVLYNSEQLKRSCLHFITINMAALLETRALEVLSEDVLLELSAAYRMMIPAMQRRVITPDPNAPDLSAYEHADWDASPPPADRSPPPGSESLLKKAKLKARRKPRKRWDSSGGYNLSDMIQSPPGTGVGLCGGSPAKANSVESLQDLMTSDSEGSYVGGGSPRDLQSPVLYDSPDTQEGGWGVVGGKTPPTVTTNGHARIPRSAPEPIPTHTAGPSQTPVLDLRAIMEMESDCVNLGATPKSPTTPKSTTVKVCLPAKLSQKQRKLLMCSRGADPPPQIPPPLPHPIRAWATAVQYPPSPQSFRALLEEEERRGQPAQAPPTSPSAAVPPPSAKRVSFKDTSEPAGPWVLGTVDSPPSVAMVTFASIVEEEKQQQAALIRSRDKPLALIQVEERAMQELLVHYGAHQNPEEFITVERSTHGPVATPTWNKH